MNALTIPLPGKRRRTIASAHTIPNTVLSGTAIAVISSVFLNAVRVSGVVTASQKGPKPCSNVFQKIIASGPSSTIAR